MQLKEYFSQAQQLQLSDTEKLFLLEKISKNKTSPQISKKFRFATQYAYASMAALIFVVILWIFVVPQNTLTDHILFWKESSFPINGVAADQIGKIVKINGEFMIENASQTQTSLVFFDGDKIILKPGTVMSFELDEGKGEIIWPAVFVVSKLSGTYHINLLQGNFFQFDGDKNNYDFLIETEDFNIHSDAGDDKDFSLQILKTEEKTYIKNNGSSLLVQKKKEEKDKILTQNTQTLASDQLLSLQKDNDILLLENKTDFVQLLAQNNLSYTRDFSSFEAEIATKDWSIQNTLPTGWESTETTPITDIPQLSLAQVSQELASLQKEGSTSISLEQSQKAQEALNYLGDNKKIPTEDQLSTISAALNPGFLYDEMREIYSAYHLDLGSAVQTAVLQKFSSKLLWIAKTFGVEIWTINLSFAEMERALQTLSTGLDAYHLPPSKTDQIDLLVQWFHLFQQEDFAQSREDFSSARPLLRFH